MNSYRLLLLYVHTQNNDDKQKKKVGSVFLDFDFWGQIKTNFSFFFLPDLFSSFT